MNRYVVLCTLGATLALCAGLLTRGVNRVAAGPLVAEAPSLPRPSAPGEPDESPRATAEQVLGRNIFDSQTGALSWQESTPAAEPEPEQAADAPLMEEPERCEEGLRLVASVVNVRNPERSYAALRKDGKLSLLTPGEQIGDMTVVDVWPTATMLQKGASTLCRLPVFLPAGERPAAAVAQKPAPKATEPAKKKAAPKQLFSDEELKQGIRPLGPNKYAISRELLTRALANPAGLSKTAKLRPFEANGRTQGMKVIAMRGNSPLAMLGIKKGDIVRKLNGFELGTPDGFLGAIGMVRQSDQLTLSVLRNNAPQNIAIVVE